MSEELANAPSNGANEAALSQPTAEPAETHVDDKPPASAREALERAFQKVQPAKEEPAKTQEQPAVKQEQPAAKTDERPRDPATGQFLPKDKTAEGKPAEQAEKTAEEPKPAQTTNVPPAPERFVKAAKEAWAQTPEVVRLETERAIAELTNGLNKYKQEAEAYAQLAPFAELAKQSGVTLAQAMANYVGIEQLLKQNPLAGFARIAQNMGLDPIAVGQALAGITPQQLVQMQQAPAQVQLPPQPQQMQPQPPGDDRLATLESMILQMQVEHFKAAHPYFDDLREEMARMLDTGYAKDLSDAYAKAIRLNPEIAAKIEAEKAAKAAPTQPATPQQPDPAQTRQKAALAITGSPSSGSNPATRKPAGSAREALLNAAAQVGLM